MHHRWQPAHPAIKQLPFDVDVEFAVYVGGEVLGE
jgi:hypothetical protein